MKSFCLWTRPNCVWVNSCSSVSDWGLTGGLCVIKGGIVSYLWGKVNYPASGVKQNDIIVPKGTLKLGGTKCTHGKCMMGKLPWQRATGVRVETGVCHLLDITIGHGDENVKEIRVLGGLFLLLLCVRCGSVCVNEGWFKQPPLV